MGIAITNKRMILDSVQQVLSVLPNCRHPAQCFLNKAQERRAVRHVHLCLRLQNATLFQSRWPCGLRCTHTTLACWLLLIGSKTGGSGRTPVNAVWRDVRSSAFSWGRKSLEREVLQRPEGKDFDQATIFMVPLQMLPDTGCDIARNFPLQQETVHFCSNFSTGSMQNKTFLGDARIICKGPQGQPARYVNTALEKGIRDLSKWPGRDVPQSRPDRGTQAASCHQA